MAIRIKLETPQNLEIAFDNGELNKLNEVVKKWNFVNKESALQFCIAVLSVTENGSLFKEKDGNKTILQPQDTLINKP